MSGFTDEERQQIREQLVEVGREMLLRYGSKKTNITDITEPVGVAKGTFYLFFDSKSDLYLEIMNREITRFTSSLSAEVEDIDDSREGFEHLCRCYREFSERNPLVDQLMVQDKGAGIRDRATAAELERIQQEGMSEMIPYIESFQEQTEGPMADVEPSLILGLMGTIGLLVLHKDEYQSNDDAYYNEVQELLITTLANGLTV